MKKQERQKPSLGTRVVERLAEFADALEAGEPISARFTRRRVTLELPRSAYGPELVKNTRAMLGASQAVFAQFLGVSLNTVRSWEQGVNTPSDLAGRFMDEIRRDPEYWRNRLDGCVVRKAN